MATNKKKIFKVLILGDSGYLKKLNLKLLKHKSLINLIFLSLIFNFSVGKTSLMN